MLIIERIMFAKGPPTSHNSLNITTQKMLLKAFSMLSCIMTQLGCRSRRVWMPKRMSSEPPGVDIIN
jgi:hypothetical protein